MSLRKTTLDSALEIARAQARADGRRVLVSLTDRIDAADPLAVMESVVQRSGSSETARELISSGQMYWSRPGDSFAMAGIGAAALFENAGAGRFASIDREWKSLVQSAVVESPSSSIRGTGPVLMGGFSFEPNGPRTELWSGFGSSNLIIPALLITTSAGESWITLNAVVSADGRTNIDATALTSLADAAIGTPAQFESATGASEDVSASTLSSAADWRRMVSKAVEEIRKGELEKVVVARAVRVFSPGTIDVFRMLRLLESVHTQSFVFGVWQSGRAFAGATPERLVRLSGHLVEASSLAGTIERGSTASEDASNVSRLRQSAKDLAEHAAVREELVAALTAACDDVRAPAEPSVLTLPHVHHLHTPLHARLRDNSSLLDLVANLHPTPAVGGSPRDAALSFIEKHENLDRGWYASPVGWIDGKGGEFAVALRSALIDENEAVLFAGCGIVADSDPDLELAESNLKLQAMQSAIEASVSAPAEDVEVTIGSELVD